MSLPFNTVRVAAVQYQTAFDASANMAASLRMIDEAARHHPQLIVLPHLCNYPAWPLHDGDCLANAAALDGPFAQAVAGRAAQHHCYIAAGFSIPKNDGVMAAVVLFDPQGQQAGMSETRFLLAGDDAHFAPGKSQPPVIETPIGAIGLYGGWDGLVPEASRDLALRGAHILCNCLAGFGRDEAALHAPARAAENKVWVVSANRVGPLMPPDMAAALAPSINAAPDKLNGAGESQIVAPDGSVLAKALPNEEAVIVAEISPRVAKDKRRPDGTDMFASRRVEVYSAPSGQMGEGRAAPRAVSVSVYQPRNEGPDAIEDCVYAALRAARGGTKLIVLPELFHVPYGQVLDTARAAHQSAQAVEMLSEVLRDTDTLVATSIVEGGRDNGQHVGVLIGKTGVLLRQPQVHVCGRHRWVDVLGAGLEICDTAYGRVCLVLGCDSIYPEMFRKAAQLGAEIVAVPAHFQEEWESALGLPERAAENRLNIAAATRPNEVGASVILSVRADFTLWTGSFNAPFDGNVSMPSITRASKEPGLTSAIIHPAASANKLLAAGMSFL